MEYDAQIFSCNNGGGYLRLYAGLPEGQFAFFHYDVGELAITAVNIANDNDAYSQEIAFRQKKLIEAPLLESVPGFTASDWSEIDLNFISFAAFVSAVKNIPDEQMAVFRSSSYSFVPSNPWERGDRGFDVHFSFDRQIKATLLSFSSIFDVLMYDSYEIRKYGVRPIVCQNCGKLFFPHSRSDEIYCNNIFKNGKTCKTLGYEMKIEADQIMKEYRRIYKMQNARKQRNQHKRNISGCFEIWSKYAKQALKLCQNGEITLEEMKRRISGTEWMS